MTGYQTKNMVTIFQIGSSELWSLILAKRFKTDMEPYLIDVTDGQQSDAENLSDIEYLSFSTIVL